MLSVYLSLNANVHSDSLLVVMYSSMFMYSLFVFFVVYKI